MLKHIDQLRKELPTLSKGDFNALHEEHFLAAHQLCASCADLGGSWDEILSVFDQEYYRRFDRGVMLSGRVWEKKARKSGA